MTTSKPTPLTAIGLRLITTTLGVALLTGSTSASANPRPLPFSLPYETLPQGTLEVVQYADLVPVRVERETPDGSLEDVWGMRSVLATELQLGLTDRLEASFSFRIRQDASGATPSMRIDGVVQRLRYRFAETAELPVDIGLYVAIAELQSEVEFEERLLLQKRLGDVVLSANVGFQQDWHFQASTTKYLFNPIAGVSYEITPRFHVGLEYWARGRLDETSDDPVTPGDDAPLVTRQYLGPTFLFQQGRLFFSLGAYARLDDWSERARVGDPYGKVWLRSLIGVEL